MAKKQDVGGVITIEPPNFKRVALRLEGRSPLMLHKFSEKMRRQIEEKQTSANATKQKRQPKDYVAEFEAAQYVSTEGWLGLPAAAIRAAMIAACRTISGLPMTKAKGAFFIIAQGRDTTDGTGLVRIEGDVQHDTRPVRLESGVADLRNRPRWDDWAVEIEIEFDSDMLSANDVAALLGRAGLQVGLGELRPQGTNSFGGDFGMFTVRAVKAAKLKAAA
jgi:hypothetical protein